MGMSKRVSRVGRGRVVLCAAVVLLAAGLVWGITGALASSSSPAPAAGKVTLRVGWTNDPDNLNPFIGYESSSYEIWHLNYDLLFGFDAKTLQTVPELAAELPTTENGGISADGKTWTVKLRQGVKWQDGQPFTAKDVAFTYNLIIDHPDEAANFSSYTKFVKHVDVVDDYTVRFNLSKPKANMFGMWILVVPEHIWSKVPLKALASSYRNDPPIIGTGPFQTTKVEKGKFVIMEANKSYWRGAPKIDEIIFNTYANSDSMAADLRAGALDVAWDIPTAQFQTLGRPPLKSISYVTKGFDELGFNCYDKPSSLGNPVLRDVKFREALNYAVDKQKIVDVAYMDHAAAATSIVQSGYYPASLDWHWEPPVNEKYTFDLNKAKAALDAAGYKVGPNGIRLDKQGKPIELRLWSRSESETSQRVGRLLTAWFRAIGLKIDYQAMDDGAMSDKMYNTNKAGQFAPDYDMFLWGWGGDVDPDFILSIFQTSQINNWSDCAWSNPEYDQLYLQQQTTIDPQARKAVIYRMEQIVYHESPYIVLVYPQDIESYNVGKWSGWVQSPEGKGGVIYTADNIDTYLFVHPKTAAVAGGGGGSNTGLIAGIVIAVVVVIGIVVWLMRRGRGGPVEEV